MKVVCAWCERQGRPALIRETEPRGGEVTHGICDDHAQLLLAELRTKQVAPVAFGPSVVARTEA